MQKLNKTKVAVVFAAVIGGWHALWSILIALGFAQSLLDFIFRLHMIKPVYTVMPFNLGTAVGLVLVTGLVGYVFGWAGAFVWNRVHKG